MRHLLEGLECPDARIAGRRIWRAPSFKPPDCFAPASTLHAPFLSAAASVPTSGHRWRRVPVWTVGLSRVFLSSRPSNTNTTHDLLFTKRSFSRHYSRNCGPVYAYKLSYLRSRLQFQREFPDILIGRRTCLNLYLQQSNVSLDCRSLSWGIPCDVRPGYTYYRESPASLLLQPLARFFNTFIPSYSAYLNSSISSLKFHFFLSSGEVVAFRWRPLLHIDTHSQFMLLWFSTQTVGSLNLVEELVGQSTVAVTSPRDL